MLYMYLAQVDVVSEWAYAQSFVSGPFRAPYSSSFRILF